ETATTLDDASRSRNGQSSFSMNTSQSTTRSNSPPSPASPLEMTKTHTNTNGNDNATSSGIGNGISNGASNGTVSNGALHSQGLMPNQEDFKKNRASTGLTLRSRAINFVHSGSPA